MTPGPELTTLPETDGRAARRQRGRRDVIDAVLDLLSEEIASPTAEQVADRAGVSVASVFRYFETLDDLRRDAIDRYFERFAHLFDVPGIGRGPRDRRIAGFVAARANQHETTRPIARLVRARAVEIPELEASLRGLREAQCDQIRRHFADELAPLTPAPREDLVATVAAITSFEAWDQFRFDHGHSPIQTSRAWRTALRRLMTPG